MPDLKPTYLLLSLAAFFGLICTSPSMAGMFPKDSKGESIWQFSGQGTYYSQSNNFYDLNNYTLSSGGDEQLLVPHLSVTDPKDQWGFTFELGYVFPSHQYDVQASGTFLDSDGNDNSIINYAIESGTMGVYRDTKSLQADFDEGEVTIGNYLVFNNRFMARLGFGAAYVSIRSSMDDGFQAFASESMAQIGSGQSDYSNTFWGIGPKLTFDGQYDLNRYFSVVAGVGASLLFGKSDLSYNAHRVIADRPENVHLDQEGDKAVFGADGNVGLRLARQMGKNISMDVELGYLASTYLNALESADSVVSTSRDLYGVQVNISEDYFNYGPYVSVGVDFM